MYLPVQIEIIFQVFLVSEDSGQPELPVFAFVITKFKKLPKKIFEICHNENFKPRRVKSVVSVVWKVCFMTRYFKYDKLRMEFLMNLAFEWHPYEVWIEATVYVNFVNNSSISSDLP